MSLKDYIRRWGIEEAARRLGISNRASKAYLYGERIPRPKIAAQIIERSNGALTLKSIYQ